MAQTLNKTIYTAEATVTGGRAGHGRTSDGLLDVDLAVPAEMGGGGGATNPEQLFAVGFAACFQGAMGVVARRQDVDITDSVITSKVSLGTAEGGAYGIAVRLDVSIPGLDTDAARELVEAAHQVCPYSNATRGNVEVTLTVS